MKPSYWGSIIYECAMGLYYSEDEAREQSWMGEHFFPLYSEESVKELQEAYTAEMLLNGEMSERIKELEQKYDKATTQLVSYEATIGYLKEALQTIADDSSPPWDKTDFQRVARECLEGLKK